VYGGCDGNANRYDSLAACQNACSGGTPDYDSCQQPSDCVVTSSGCCGVCDGPSVRLHDLIAYNRSRPGMAACSFAREAPAPRPNPGPGDPISCAPCPSATNGTLRYFVPDCVQGQCIVTDLRQSPLTACSRSDECKLRRGASCCESCSAGDLIAIRSDVSLEELVCGDGLIGCDPCAAEPVQAAAYCGDDGHCQVTYPVP
jgi:hypothetical protein